MADPQVPATATAQATPNAATPAVTNAAPAPATVTASSSPAVSNKEAPAAQAATGATQANAADPKAQEAQQPKEEIKAPAVPERYDLKLPDGSLVDAELAQKIEADCKARGLSQEQAQANAKLVAENLQAFVETKLQAQQKTAEAWPKQIQADPVYGGDKFLENTAYAERAWKQFAPPELKTEVERLGLGNYPPLWKWAVNVGRAAANDRLVIPGAQSGGGPKSKEDVMFPLEEITVKAGEEVQ